MDLIHLFNGCLPVAGCENMERRKQELEELYVRKSGVQPPTQR
jgi:hypothetical protein